MRVEVAYARAGAQLVVSVEVCEGATARQAIDASGIAARIPDLDLAQAVIGVFGRVVSPAYLLEEGDRVEIYRRLLADPKFVRRERAARGKARR